MEEVDSASFLAAKVAGETKRPASLWLGLFLVVELSTFNGFPADDLNTRWKTSQ